MSQIVLITGVAGFIGSHLAERLLHDGYQILGLDNFDDYYPISIKYENIRLLGNERNFKLIKGDIRDSALLNDIFSRNRISVVMHLAARAGVRPSVEYPLLYQDVNVMGTLNLLQACKDSNVEKFVFASSSSVYGLNNSPPFKEDANVNQPVSPYAASKASAELFCRTYNHLYTLPVTVLRLFTVYGPRQRPEMAIHRFTRQIYNGEEVSVFGDGSTNRDYTYVEDIVDGLVAAMNYRDGSFQIFNLGAGQTVYIGKLLEIIENSLTKKARIKYVDRVPGDVPSTDADISKAALYLGYKPKFNIEQGISNFVEWYLKNKES